MISRLLLVLALVAALLPVSVRADEEWKFKGEMLSALDSVVPKLLQQQDPKTGRFGSGLWIPPDQLPIYPLAVAWALTNNPYYHDPKVLEAVMLGGDQLIGAQDKTGQWEFRKKDNSAWGLHYNPWVYSRWVRTYALIRDGMPAERRTQWEKALTLGYTGIARRELSRVINIPAHHAMGLYIAGKTFGHPEWCAQASAFLEKIAAAQDPNGFWSEHYGPVVTYNFVYLDALGVYYSLSHDGKVLEALERGARFHANFIYPDGSNIETVDERVPYSTTAHLAGLGLSFSPTGRAYLREQWQHVKNDTSTATIDFIVSMLLYGEEGIAGEYPATNRQSLFVSADHQSSVLRQGPWCASFSGYVCPIAKDRWIQDRQNFVSLFHEKTGLILGGGNTKLQPLWSTFTVGDTKLLQHKPGDKKPDFTEPVGLLHIPSHSTLDAPANSLTLLYGSNECNVSLTLPATNKAHLVYSTKAATNLQAVAAHVTFLPALEKTWRTASGKSGSLKDPFALTAAEAGAWFEHNGWRVQLPAGSHLTWPVLRHNPYRDDGRADLGDGRIVLMLPFSKDITKHEIDLEVLP